MTNLDNLFAMITEVSDDQIETTAEKLIALADGKSREAWPGVTFLQLKELMISIIETKYFVTEAKTATNTTPNPTDNAVDNSNTSTAKPEETANTLNGTQVSIH